MGYRDTHMESPGPGLRVRVDTYTKSLSSILSTRTSSSCFINNRHRSTLTLCACDFSPLIARSCRRVRAVHGAHSDERTYTQKKKITRSSTRLYTHAMRLTHTHTHCHSL